MQIGSYICVEIGDKSIENKKNHKISAVIYYHDSISCNV